MKMKKAILSCLMLMGVLSVSAQEHFGKMISPTIQGAVGYQFSKSVGARLGINAWQSRTGWKDDAGFEAQNFKYSYFAPALDLTFDLSNIIAGYNPMRKVSFGAFIGIGLNYRMQSDDAKNAKAYMDFYARQDEFGWTPMYNDDAVLFFKGQAGLTADYHINDAWSIGLEANFNMLSDRYNFKKVGNPDSYFNLLAGIKYNFGPTYSTRFIPAPEPEIRYVDKIVEKIVEVPAPAPAAVEPLRRDIFFEINKTIIRDSEKQKVQDIADYMNAHPTSKVMITGYADAGTGNDRINDRLAKGRAQVVVKALKEQYGIR